MVLLRPMGVHGDFALYKKLNSYTRAIFRFSDVVWYDFNATKAYGRKVRDHYEAPFWTHIKPCLLARFPRMGSVIFFQKAKNERVKSTKHLHIAHWDAIFSSKHVALV